MSIESAVAVKRAALSAGRRPLVKVSALEHRQPLPRILAVQQRQHERTSEGKIIPDTSLAEGG